MWFNNGARRGKGTKRFLFIGRDEDDSFFQDSPTIDIERDPSIDQLRR